MNQKMYALNIPKKKNNKATHKLKITKIKVFNFLFFIAYVPLTNIVGKICYL